MVAAVATGWLPGPGGLPLFIIGLSLFAINHEWAKRYIDIIKKNADRVWDMVFVKNPRIQLFYDVIAPVFLAGGIYLLIKHSALWMISVGIFCLFMGFTLLLGNRKRWQRLRNRVKLKH